MHKFFRFLLISNRKRRRLALGAALWLLRILRDIEYDEMVRYEHLIDCLDCVPNSVSRQRYRAAEDEWSICECALGFIDSAVDDLDLVFKSVY